MITLRYDRVLGNARSDYGWITWVNDAVDSHENSLRPIQIEASVANALPIMYLLTLVAEEAINREHVTLMYGDVALRPNEYGAILDWPNGFCDTEDQLASRRLRAQVRRRREKRNEKNPVGFPKDEE